METRMLVYEHVSTLAEIATWANELVGAEVPGFPGYRAVRVVDFQVLTQHDYTALVLVEIEQGFGQNELELKEADIVEIERLTSAIGEMPEKDGLAPGEETA